MNDIYVPDKLIFLTLHKKSTIIVVYVPTSLKVYLWIAPRELKRLNVVGLSRQIHFDKQW